MSETTQNNTPLTVNETDIRIVSCWPILVAMLHMRLWSFVFAVGAIAVLLNLPQWKTFATEQLNSYPAVHKTIRSVCAFLYK